MAELIDVQSLDAAKPWPNVYPPTTVDVSVDVKVVAGGIKISNGKRTLQFSLVFSPKAPDGGKSFQLADWPAEIEAICAADLSILVSCLPETFDATTARPRPDPATAVALNLRPILAGERASAIDAIGACWKTMIGTGDPSHQKTPWEALSYLYSSESPSQTPQGATRVVGVPRGDMALFLQSWRARVVLGRLAGDAAPKMEPGCDYLNVLEDWLLNTAELDDMALGGLAQASGDNAPTNPSATDLEAIAQRHAAEQANEAAVREKASKAGESIFGKRKNYLDQTSAADALKVHAEQCAPNTFCEAPFSITADLMEGNSKTIHKLYGTFRTLNGAQLSLDGTLKKHYESTAVDKVRTQPKWEAPRTIPLPKVDPAFQEAVAAVKRKLFTLQAIPSLARVFRFVVDAEADLGELPASPGGLPATALGDAGTDMMSVLGKIKPLRLLEADSVDMEAFGDVSALLSSEDTQTITNYLFLSAPYGKDAPWTSVKLRYPTGESSSLDTASGHFMPCSMEEMDLAAVLTSPDRDPGLADKVGCSRNCNDASGKPLTRYILPAMRDGLLLQFDGVLDLGAGRRAILPSDRRPRYDIVSLDVVAAMESQANLVRSRTEQELTRGLHARPTYRSAGLMLIDRWRAAAMASSMADAKHRSDVRVAGGPVVFDANALTVGYRVDVGIRQKGRADRLHTWRTLGNRVVRYSYPLQPWLVEDELTRLGLPAGSETRIRMDSTPILPGASVNADVRYPEEILVCWEGDPLGVQCVQDPGGKSTTVHVSPSQDLAISRFYELPDEGEPGFRIPRLTFGKRYRLGLRADYVGGVTAPLERARAIYEEASGGMLALPEAPMTASGKWIPAVSDSPRAKGRRFLRHERLLSPEVAIPEDEVDVARMQGSRARLRDLSAHEAVVRTAVQLAKTAASLNTDRVTRILIPPGVSQDFAEWHGVLRTPDLFSGRRKLAQRASVDVVVVADGLKNVAYDAEKGGLRRRTSANIASIKASLTADVEKRSEADINDRDGDPVFVIDSVTEGVPTRSGARARKHIARKLPYFPDPAAHTMVLAIRKPGFAADKKPEAWEDPEQRNPNDYIRGKPAVLDLTHPCLRYPDVLTVALEVQRTTAAVPRKIEDLTHETAMPQSHRTTGSIERDGFVARSIDAAMIGRGHVPATRARIELAPGEEFELDTWCVPSVEQLDSWFDIVETSAMLAIVKQCVETPANALNDNAACSAGLASLLGASEAMQFDRLLRDYGVIGSGDNECSVGGLPVPGAELRRQIARNLHDYMLLRPIPEIAAVQTLRMVHAVGAPNYAPAFRPSTAQSVSDNMQLGGLDIIRLDLGTADGPPADTPAAAAKRQDEKMRDFINQHRVEDWHASGKPTHAVQATNLLVGGSLAIDLDTCSSVTVYASLAHPHTETFDDMRIGRRTTGDGRDAEYGFTVLPSRRITFDRQQVVLAKLESLQPSPKMEERRDGTEVVDLLFDGEKIRDRRGRYQPTDYKARHMRLAIEATTRFGSDFDWAPRLATDGSLVAAGKSALFDGTKSGWITSSTITVTPSGKAYDMWLPATKRPDPIDPLSILPAFVWHEEQSNAATTVVTRRTVVRLRFRRPWFSSGEDERLGIVLWPPNIFDAPPSETDFPVTNLGAIQDLIDKELKEGTGYITRSGFDPIRQGGNLSGGPFMPLESFRIDGNELVSRVPRVTLPLPTATDDPTLSGQRTLDVALIAFEPLFDPIDEFWYVDVDISGRQMPDGWVRFGLVRYQPHAIAGQEVSEPTTAFTQILPLRTVKVKRDRVAGAPGTRVQVTVEGVGSLGAAKDDRVTDPNERLYMHRPVVAMTVTRTTQLVPTGGSESAQAEEMVVAEFRGMKSEEQGYVRATHGDEGLVWRKDFVLDDLPPYGAKYRLLIEEIDLRPLASSDASEIVLKESGPRFIATIEL